ncbi:MAG TPA: VOC family protein [Actinoplanes sp.]|nr:VOC family protein [Actinoplanes sp.]
MDSVVHFELPADDVDRAQTFYREAFDWKLTSMPDMGYTMINTTVMDETGRPTTPGAINGGMLARQAPVNAPVITISVDDIDDTLARIEKLGGRTALGRQAVGDMGYSAYFTDTEGNVIGLWQNA